MMARFAGGRETRKVALRLGGRASSEAYPRGAWKRGVMKNVGHTNQSTSQFLKEIEGTPYFQFMGNAGKMFKELRDLALTRAETGIADDAQFEIEIHHLAEKHQFIDDDYRERFVGVFGTGDGGQWPDMKGFSQEQFTYYQLRLSKTTNPFLKCRYADLLFECNPPGLKLNRFELGKILVNLLIETGEIHLQQVPPDYPFFLYNIARAADVAIKLNNAGMLARVVDSLMPVLSILRGKDLRWVYETSRIMRGVYSSPLTSTITSDSYLTLRHRVDEARAYFWESEDLLTWHRSFCEELVAWERLHRLGDEHVRRYSREIGESYEREAGIKAKKYGSHMMKAKFLEKALQHYVKIGITDKIGELKIRIREAHAASQKEYIPMTWTLEIPTADIEKLLAPYRSVPVEDCLGLAASDPRLVINVASVERQTLEEKATSAFMFAVPKFVIDDDRKVFQSESDDDSFKFMANHEYKMNVIKTQIFLECIFEVLIKEREIKAEDFFSFLRGWSMLDDKNAALLEVGIERFFARDYVSALHILVPQLESCVRRMFAKAGYPTTSIKKGITQHEQTFTEFLGRDDVKNELGPNFHKYCRWFLVDQTGLNLRNDIAHGLIRIEKCNETNVQTVLHLLLMLTRYRLKSEEISP